MPGEGGRRSPVIVGAFYWALLLVGGIVVLFSALGVVVQLQDRPLDPGSVGLDVGLGAFGAVIAGYCARALLRGKAGLMGAALESGYSRSHIAGRGCLFVLIVVGACLILAGPLLLVQLPDMAPGDQGSFGIGALSSIIIGAILAIPSGLMLWRRRDRPER